MKILVFIARGLQAAYVGCYGNSWVVTPTLDRLAAEGVVFDQHYADCVDPLAVGKTWQTGRYHFAHAKTLDHEAASLSLLDVLRQADIPAVLIKVARTNAQRGTNELYPDWKEIVEPSSEREPLSEFASVLRKAERVVGKLRKCADWLIWVDVPTLLPPWRLPSEYRDVYFEDEASQENDDNDGNSSREDEQTSPWTGPLPDFVESSDDTLFDRLRRTYGGAVTFLDDFVAKLLGLLEANELLDDLLLLFTSDLGLPLGEHGGTGERVSCPFEELVHLPLIVRLPGGAEAGRRIAGLTQSVDLMPTILGALGKPPSGIHGHSLLPLCHGQVGNVRSYAISGLHLKDCWALRTPNWAFFLSERDDDKDSVSARQLYAKPADRWEVNDLIQHHPELAQHLEETLRAFASATCQPGAFIPPALPLAVLGHGPG